MGKEKGPRLDIGVKIVTETNYNKCDNNDDNDDENDENDDENEHNDNDLCS